jgi:hypothetical protein
MGDAPQLKCKVECPCGWADVFSSAFGGLLVHCPQCGKRHRIPMFGDARIDDDIDMKVMGRLLDRSEKPSTPISVKFPPVLLYTSAFALVTACVALVVVEPMLPNAVAVAGGALAWPLAIFVAWMGQKRHVRQIHKRSVQEG